MDSHALGMMTTPKLREYARSLGLDAPPETTKFQLVQAILAAQEPPPGPAPPAPDPWIERRARRAEFFKAHDTTQTRERRSARAKAKRAELERLFAPARRNPNPL